MANLKKTDLPETETTDQKTLMEEMFARLQQMQKDIDEKMAALAERERALNDAPSKAPASKAPSVSKAWSEMKTIFLPRAHAGEENFVMVGVNGQQWKVPRGLQVEVPAPLFERLEIMLDQEERAYQYRMELLEKAEQTQAALMRVR